MFVFKELINHEPELREVSADAAENRCSFPQSGYVVDGCSYKRGCARSY